MQQLCEQLAPYLPKGLPVAEVAPDGRFHLHPSVNLGSIDPRCIEGHADARVKRLAAEFLRLREGAVAAKPVAPVARPAGIPSGRKLVISARWQRSKCLVVVDGQEIAMPAKPFVIMAKLGLGRQQEEGWVDRDQLDSNADASWSAMTRVYDHLRDAGVIPADVIENNLAKSYRLAYLAEQIEIDRTALLRHPHEPVRAELARFVAGP